MVTKKRVDTGIRNNPSTGDVLADGGDKINIVIDDLYDKFGDRRLNIIDHGIDRQTLHATGYYQKHDRNVYGSVVEMGSRHDIDTTLGAITFRLPKVKQGECIEIINSTGSISSDKYLRIVCDTMDSFPNGDKEMIIRTPRIDLKLWGIDSYGGRGTWDYSINNLIEKSYTTTDINTNIDTTGSEFVICNKNDYRVIKFLMYFIDVIDGSSRSSEIILHINSIKNEITYTEYSVMGMDHENLYDMEFYIDGDDVKLSMKSGVGNNTRFIMRSIESL